MKKRGEGLQNQSKPPAKKVVAPPEVGQEETHPCSTAYRLLGLISTLAARRGNNAAMGHGVIN